MFHTSLSRLLIIVITSLSLLSITAILWNTQRIQNDVERISWLELTSRISALAMRINAVAAMERGITSTALAAGKIDEDVLQTLKQQRALHNEYYSRLSKLQTRMMEIQPQHVARHIWEAVVEQRSVLLRLRQQADSAISANGSALQPQQWFDQLTTYITTVETFRLSLNNPDGTANTHLEHHLLFDAGLSRLSEHLGRERALVARAIAEARPLTASERAQLSYSRSVIEESRRMLEQQLVPFSGDDHINMARKKMHDELTVHYEVIRGAVYQAEAEGASYPVSAAEWFEDASRAVDSVIVLAEALNNHLAQDVLQVRQTAERSAFILNVVIAVIVLVFAYTAHVIFRRVVVPLQRLRSSAMTISRGELESPIVVDTKDELGQLGRAMEMMRVALLDDRSEREQNERVLRKLTHVLEQSVSAIVITDPDGVVEYVNPQFSRDTGYEPKEIVGRKHNLLGSNHTPEYVYRDLWQTISQGKIWEGELVNRKKDGSVYHNLVIISPVKNKHGLVKNFVGIYHDITQHRELESHLAHVASHDQLTGLPNRSLLAERFEKLCMSQNDGQGSLTISVLNIRRFSGINENLGHKAGDQVLQEVARRLNDSVQMGDTVARFGADEFVLLLNEPKTPDTATSYVDYLIEQASAPILVQGQSLNISFVSGISLCPRDGQELDDLIAKAESALAQAKGSQGQPIRYFTAEMNDIAARRFRIEADLKRAIEINELSLYFQPKVNLASGQPVGAEALARWTHPELGAISPAEFIPVSEESGTIVELGNWVLTEACRTLKEWHASQPGLRMGVNVCAYQLYSEEFAKLVEALIERFSLPADCLELEITEGVVMENPELMAERLNQLKDVGVRLAIDDFGTGYSSLAQLMRFPFDILKVDREFVKNITTSPDSAGLAKLIVSLGSHMNLQVVAEGAETEAQACYLRQLGCEVLQGFYYSHPLPAHEALNTLSSVTLSLPDCSSGVEEKTILLLDDEVNILRSLRRVLRRDGYKIVDTTEPDEAFNLLAIHQPQVVLVDQRMPSMDGVEFLQKVKELYPEMIRIVLSGYTDLNTVTSAVNRGHIYKFMTKPWNDEELCSTVAEAFEAHIKQRSIHQQAGKV